MIELARERRPDIYRLDVWRPAPLVPRHLRFNVEERTLADGVIEQAVDEADVEALAAELAERGIEAIAICFLHSFANPANEQAARAAVERAAPGLRVAIFERRRARDPRVRRADDRRERLRAAAWCATSTISKRDSPPWAPAAACA